MNMADFTSYCISFYGPRGLYPMKMTEEDVSRAVRLSRDDWKLGGLMGILSTGRRVRDVVRVMRGDKTSTNWEI
jgi:hypothetical protein